MLGANAPEVAAVRRDQSFELQPLRHRHQRGIDQAQKVVLAKQLRAPGEVGLDEMRHQPSSFFRRLPAWGSTSRQRSSS